MEDEHYISTKKVLGNTEENTNRSRACWLRLQWCLKEKSLHLRVNEKFSLIKSQNSLTFTNFSLKLEAMSQHRSFNAPLRSSEKHPYKDFTHPRHSCWHINRWKSNDFQAVWICEAKILTKKRYDVNFFPVKADMLLSSILMSGGH